MKNIKFVLLAFLLAGVLYKADAQYGYGYGYGPLMRHRQQQPQPEEKDQGPSKPSGYFAVSIGLAVPQGSFTNAISTNYNGGYALPGMAVNISLGIPVAHSNIGVALMYGNYNNPFDINSYVNNIQVSDQNKSYGPVLQDSYNESFIMGGLFWTWPVQRLSFDARAMVGVAICNLPEVTYGAQQYDPTLGGYDQYQWDYAPSSTTAFAYDLGGDIRYRVRRASIMFGVDFIHANPMINTTLDYTDQNNVDWYSHVSGGVSISDIVFNLGIAYQINSR
jgi:hypothetical protein